MEKNNQNIDELLAVAVETAKKAGEYLRGATTTVLSSIDKDIKLSADIETHKIIIESLTDTELPILSEEDTEHTFSHERVWIVDPLDGSLNYVRGMPSCAVSIALWGNNEPVLGVVFDFNRNELYSGLVGSGAWMNDVPIHVSGTKEKADAVIMSGFPSYTDYSDEALYAYIKRVQEFKKVRLIGSAALSLAYVASGRADAYYESGIKLWDVAAGLALVRAAGGAYASNASDAHQGYKISAASITHLLIS